MKKIILLTAIFTVLFTASCSATPSVPPTPTPDPYIFEPVTTPLKFEPESLPVGQLGEDYEAEILISDNVTPVNSASISDGTLPAGLELVFVDGEDRVVIRGEPEETGTFTFTLFVTCFGTMVSGQTGQKEYTLIVDGPTSQLNIRQSAVELVSDEVAVGDGGNLWGGHQTRIVRTGDGVFTAYIVPGADDLHREWRLVKRDATDGWQVIAQGETGREPVNLLAAPDGTLYIFGWPGGAATLWSGKPQGDEITMTPQLIPDQPNSNWPYSSAGIASNGTLCLLASNGGETPGGEFYWSCYLPESAQWLSRVTELDYRYCYTYVFPDALGGLSLVSTRDVRWSALGLETPQGAFDYAFNAFGFWRTENLLDTSLALTSYVEEPATADYPEPDLNAQMDAYQDSHGNMHILYWRKGETTRGEEKSMHRIITPAGDILFDAPLPDDIGYYVRIFQDGRENFYLLGSSGTLYLLDERGEQPVDSLQLDLGGYEVEYSGYGLSVPRTGTPAGNIMDVVFTSGDETQWLYFQIEFVE